MLRSLTSFLLALTLASAAFAQGAPPAPPPPPAPPAPPAPPEAPELDLYTRASLAMHRESWGEALASFDRLLAEQPTSRLAPEARFWRGHCLDRLGKRSEARAAWMELVTTTPDSGWAKDAAARLAAPAPAPRADAAPFEVVTKDGGRFTARVRRLGGDSLTVEGGPYTAPTELPWGDVVKLRRQGGEGPAVEGDVVVLENGDMLSGTFVGAEDGQVLLEGKAFGRLALPREGIATFDRAGAPFEGVFVGGEAGEGFAFQDEDELRFEVEGDDPLVALLDEQDEDEDDDGARTTTRTEPDGSRTTVHVAPDGTTTTTTTTRDGKNVTVRRTSPNGGGEGHGERHGPGERKRVVVRIEGDDGDEPRVIVEGADEEEVERDVLRDLPAEVRARVRAALRKVELPGPEVRKKIEEALRAIPRDDERTRRTVEEALRDAERAMRDGARARADAGERAKRTVENALRMRRVMPGQPAPAPQGGGRRVIIQRDGEHGEHGVAVLGHGGEGGPRVVWSQAGGGGDGFFKVHALAAGPNERTDVDRVFLENGDVLSGAIVSMDEKTVRLKASYGDVSIERKQVLRITFKRPGKPFLGVSLEAREGGGVAVTQVHAGSGAAAAGLAAGDVVKTVDGATLRDAAHLHELLRGKEPGQVVKLGVARGDQTLDLSVTLGERKEEPASLLFDRAVPAVPGVAPRAPRAPVPPTPPAPPAPPAPPPGGMTPPAPPPPPPPGEQPRRRLMTAPRSF